MVVINKQKKIKQKKKNLDFTLDSPFGGGGGSENKESRGLIPPFEESIRQAEEVGATSRTLRAQEYAQTVGSFDTLEDRAKYFDISYKNKSNPVPTNTFRREIPTFSLEGNGTIKTDKAIETTVVRGEIGENFNSYSPADRVEILKEPGYEFWEGYKDPKTGHYSPVEYLVDKNGNLDIPKGWEYSEQIKEIPGIEKAGTYGNTVAAEYKNVPYGDTKDYIGTTTNLTRFPNGNFEVSQTMNYGDQKPAYGYKKQAALDYVNASKAGSTWALEKSGANSPILHPINNASKIGNSLLNGAAGAVEKVGGLAKGGLVGLGINAATEAGAGFVKGLEESRTPEQQARMDNKVARNDYAADLRAEQQSGKTQFQNIMDTVGSKVADINHSFAYGKGSSVRGLGEQGNTINNIGNAIGGAVGGIGSAVGGFLNDTFKGLSGDKGANVINEFNNGMHTLMGTFNEVGSMVGNSPIGQAYNESVANMQDNINAENDRRNNNFTG